MEMEKIRRILITKQVKNGIHPIKSGFKEIATGGIDTETINGKNPYLFSLQLVTDDVSEFKLAKGMSVEEILEFIFSCCKRGSTILFAHSLSFELTSMFGESISSGERDYGNFTITKILQPMPCWMKVIDKDEHKSVEFIDTISYFHGSLENAAKTFNLAMKKLERPSYLGEREPREDEWSEFVAYAMRDAEVAHLLGKEIINFHREYNVDARGSVSPATLSAKVFKKHYLSVPIPFPRWNITKLAMQAYHGGRTEAMIYGTADCKVYDYNSAYPFAASEITVPMNRNCWKKVNEFSGECGFYILSGEIPEKKISPLPFRDNRLIFPVGKFKKVVVTGYEAKHIIECAKINSIKGYVYYGESSECLRNFVYDFYKKKNESVDNPVLYTFNKTTLNGNYGKFMQLNPIGDEMRNSFGSIFDQINNRSAIIKDVKKYQASGMFNPVIASQITGYVRAMLYEMMNKYEPKVFYTDTDSIICQRNCSLPSGNKLGQFKLEKEGMATILREKLYLLKQDDKIVKSATHGFWRRGDELWAMLKEGRDHYQVPHMVKINEAIRQHKQALSFETQDRMIRIAPSMKRYIPEDWKKIDFLKEHIELPAITLK